MPDAPTPPERETRRGRAWRHLTAVENRTWVLRGVAATAILCVLSGQALVAFVADEQPVIAPIWLSDVGALLADGIVARAEIGGDEQTVALVVYPDRHTDALKYVDAYIEAIDGDEVARPTGEQELRLVTPFPIGSGDEQTAALLESDVSVGALPKYQTSAAMRLIGSTLPIVLILVGAFFLMGRQGAGFTRFGAGGDIEVERPTTRFADVAGADEAVDELRDLVSYLTDPEVWRTSGARAPKGALLDGPPGTGKTLLARAVAGEAGVPFFAVSGADFVEMFVGVGAKRVRNLFAKAREAGRAVVFIDEIDAIGRQRSGGGGVPGNEETERTLNQLLVEMDGFDDHTELLVLAATNRADTLDDALVRPGRFDRRVSVNAPDITGREAILAVHARDKQLADDVDLASFAARTQGMTGASLENLLNTAALLAAKDSRTVLRGEDLEEALQRVVLGRARTTAVVSDEDRTITAWHEAGHAIAALAQPAANDPVTVTIVPRGHAGGVTWMSGNDRMFTTRTEAVATLVTAMAGRAAEEMLLGMDNFTTGPSSDLQAATATATAMITTLGMGTRLAVVDERRHQAGAGPDWVDDAIEALLVGALKGARALLARERVAFDTLIERLLDQGTVTQSGIDALRPLLAAATADVD
jgi:cell division protease FtsH